MGMPKFEDSSISKSIEEHVNNLDHKALVLWATDCAEHVLAHFVTEARLNTDEERNWQLQHGQSGNGIFRRRSGCIILYL